LLLLFLLCLLLFLNSTLLVTPLFRLPVFSLHLLLPPLCACCCSHLYAC
jgi:hypothetical protein